MLDDLISRAEAKAAVEAAIVRCKHDSGTGMKPACKTQRHFAALACSALDAVPAAEGRWEKLRAFVELLDATHSENDDPFGLVASVIDQMDYLSPPPQEAGDALPKM